MVQTPAPTPPMNYIYFIPLTLNIPLFASFDIREEFHMLIICMYQSIFFSGGFLQPNQPFVWNGVRELYGTVMPNNEWRTKVIFMVIKHLMPPQSWKEVCALNKIHKVESVQKRAARYACNQYGRTDSVSKMITELGWNHEKQNYYAVQSSQQLGRHIT